MKKLYYIVLFLPFLNFSQQFTWAKHWAYQGEVIGKETESDENNNLYVTGTFDNSGHGGNKYTGSFLSKYDSQGNLIWNKIFFNCFDPQITFSNNTLFFSGKDSLGCFVTKYQTNGNQISRNTFINAGTTAQLRMNDIKTSNNGEYYVAGSYHLGSINIGDSTYTSNNNSVSKLFLAKFSSTDSCTWSTTSSEGNISNIKIAVSPSGSLALAAAFGGTFVISNHTLVPHPGSSHSMMLLFDETGQVKKSQVNGSNYTGITTVDGIAFDQDEIIIIGIYYYSFSAGSTQLTSQSNSSINNLESNIFIIKLNSNFDPVWAKQIGDGYYDYCSGLSVKNGKIIIAGTFAKTTRFTENFSLTTDAVMLNYTIPHEPFVACYDIQGEFNWAVNTGAGPDGRGTAHGVHLNQNNVISFTGQFYDQMSFGNNNLAHGSYCAFVTQINSQSVVGTDHGQTLQFKTLSYYPNPAKDELFLFYESPEPIKNIKIFEVTGKEIYQKELSKNTYSINDKIKLLNQSKGVYILEIKTETNSVRKKLVIE